jgi:hypothetical protein
LRSIRETSASTFALLLEEQRLSLFQQLWASGVSTCCVTCASPAAVLATFTFTTANNTRRLMEGRRRKCHGRFCLAMEISFAFATRSPTAATCRTKVLCCYDNTGRSNSKGGGPGACIRGSTLCTLTYHVKQITQLAPTVFAVSHGSAFYSNKCPGHIIVPRKSIVSFRF